MPSTSHIRCLYAAHKLVSEETSAMSRADPTLAAASRVVANLARGNPFPPHLESANGHNGSVFNLPGPDGPAKRELEAELLALASRVRYLEQRAEIVGKSMPDTPGESQPPSSPGSRPADLRSNSSFGSSDSTTGRSDRQSSISTRTKRVNHLLAARDVPFGGSETERSVSEDDIGLLREHVERQAQEIKSQRSLIDEISRGLRRSEEQAKEAFIKVEREDVSMLERELRKHQQANEAFQKALREIGEVITRVANGDLSSRVQIQATELDNEIVNFKTTINTMMDQLETFGSEVTRVAREVGTDGVLGGQARIVGVRGIWKELTDNGMCKPKIYGVLTVLITSSEHNGSKLDRPSQRNRNSHKSSRQWRFDTKSTESRQRRNFRATADYQHHGGSIRHVRRRGYTGSP